MRSPWLTVRGCAAGVLATMACTLCLASSAHAQVTAILPAGCDGQLAVQPFKPWADPADYVLVPHGTAESRAGWQLSGGAAHSSGNEAFFVNREDDAASLALPPGSSATTSAICVGLEHPTMRLFVRNRGSVLSSLLVEVLFTDASGRRRALPIGALAGTATWQPTPPLPVLANLLSALPGPDAVAFRFTPWGAGDWSIDDVYVDPFRHG